MRNASGSLIALLNSSTQFYVADVLTITQANGTVTRLTSADVDVTTVSQADGLSHTFSSTGPRFTRDQTKLGVGLEVDAMRLVLMPDPVAHLLGGVPWPAAAATGALDEARVVLERAFMAAWGNTAAGTLILFSGRVGQVLPSRATVTMTVNSDLELLRAAMPRNTYQAGCLHTLYDSGCGINRTSYAVSGTAITGSTVNQLNVTDAHVTGYFDLGTVTFLTGANAGQTRTIKAWTSGGVLVPAQPFAAAPAAGDTFTMSPGCDKAASTCSAKFSNLARFRGFPQIPSPEAAR